MRSVSTTGRLLMKIRPAFCINDLKAKCSTSSTTAQNEEKLKFLSVMREVPLPVVVVTAARRDGSSRRGFTCSSFTSVSASPPVVSVCLRQPSRFLRLVTDTQRFNVHVLADGQVSQSMHFSRPPSEREDQFDGISHSVDPDGVPLLPGVAAGIRCSVHKTDVVGDHAVIYGQVLESIVAPDRHPMVFYNRAYHSLADATFMAAFEHQTLPFEDWTHEAHVRMAWNYLRTHPPPEAQQLIRQGIQRYNDVNKTRISLGYNETVTACFMRLIAAALRNTGSVPGSGGKTGSATFEGFRRENPHLFDSRLIYRHYSKELLGSSEAKERFLEPDREPLPALL